MTGEHSLSFPGMAYTTLEPNYIFLQYAMSEAAEALRALGEARRLAGILEQVQTGVERLEWRSVIRELRAALTASANVSKVFWPVALGVAQTRGGALRVLCGVPDEHGAKSRKLRNHIEHTDERLDKWLANGPRPFLTVEHVAHAEPDRPPEISAEIAATCLLTYDVASDVVTYIGESFSLAELEAQLHEVQDYIGHGLSELTKKWPSVTG